MDNIRFSFLTAIAHSSMSHLPSPTLVKNIRATIAQYEKARLAAFSQNEEIDQHIRYEHLNEDVFACNFPEVGYFNSIQGLTKLDQSVYHQLSTFYQGYTGPVKAGIFPHSPSGGNAQKIAQYVRLYGDLSTLNASHPKHSNGSIILASEYSDGKFSELYLKVLEATPVRRNAALSNLKLLCQAPGIHSYLILQDGQPVGISVLFVHKDWCFLAGGGVLPEFRRKGLHHFSLLHRLNLAKNLGCKHVVSWTYSRDQSCNNLQRVGLKIIFEEPIYLLNFQ